MIVLNYIVGGSIVGGSIVGGSIVGGSIVGGSIVGGSIVAHPFLTVLKDADQTKIQDFLIQKMDLWINY